MVLETAIPIILVCQIIAWGPRDLAITYSKSLTTPNQFECLHDLWKKESNWNYKARNSKSRAYGIPQALPGRKMGKGWRNNSLVQVNWGLKYINKRYGSPCAAYKFWAKNRWY